MEYQREFKKDFEEIMQYVACNRVRKGGSVTTKIYNKDGRILTLIDTEDGNIAYYEYDTWRPFPVIRMAYLSLDQPDEISIFDFDNIGRSLRYRNSSGTCAHYLYLRENTHTIAAKLICYENKVLQIIINERFEIPDEAEAKTILIPMYLQEKGLKCNDSGVLRNIIRAKIIISE